MKIEMKTRTATTARDMSMTSWRSSAARCFFCWASSAVNVKSESVPLVMTLGCWLGKIDSVNCSI